MPNNHEKENNNMNIFKIKRNISMAALLLTLLMTFAACGPTKTPKNEDFGSQNKSSQNDFESKGDYMISFGDDAGEVTEKAYKILHEKYIERMTKPYSFREEVWVSLDPVYKDDVIVTTDQTPDGDKKRQVNYKRANVPNEYLTGIYNTDFGLRIKGFVDPNKNRSYRQSVNVWGRNAGERAITLPNSTLEYTGGSRRFISLLPDTKSDKVAAETGEGYVSQGRPEENVFETAMITSIPADKLFKMYKESKYLVKSGVDKENTNYTLVFDNTKLLKFTKLAYQYLEENEEAKNNFKTFLLNRGVDLGNKDNSYFKDNEYITDMFLDNLMEYYAKGIATDMKDLKNIPEKIESNLSKLFKILPDQTLDIKSYILTEVNQVVDNEVKSNGKIELAHTLESKQFRDFMRVNKQTSYISLDESPDKEGLMKDMKADQKIEITKQLPKELTTYSNLYKDKIFSVVQLQILTEFSQDEIDSYRKKIELKPEGELKAIGDRVAVLETLSPYENLKDGDIAGFSREESSKREGKLRNFYSWLSQDVMKSRMFQAGSDYTDNSYDVTQVEDNSPNLRMFKITGNWIGNMVEKVVNPLEPGKKDNEETDTSKEENAEDNQPSMEELIANMTPEAKNIFNKVKDLESVKKVLGNEGYGDVFVTNLGKNIKDIQLENSKTLGDYALDKNKPTVYMIGEYWCYYCRESLKNIAEYGKITDKVNFVFVSDASESKWDEVKLKPGEEDDGKKIGNWELFETALTNSVYDTVALKNAIPVNYFPTFVVTDTNGNMIYVGSSLMSPEEVDSFVNEILEVEATIK